MAKVSVIIPIYGVEKYLRECLDSIINQTLKDIEIICIDDGSKDNCPKIIDEYAKKDLRIKVVHKINGGYGQSCNVGLKMASGEYIAILEPDDFIDKNMYEDLYNLAKENDADIVKSSFYENFDIKNYKKIKQVGWFEKEPCPTGVFEIKDCPLFLYFHPSIWSCIYKRDFITGNNISFVEAKGAGWTDNPFQVQTMCLAKRICYTNKAYYYWRKLNLDESKDLKDYTVPFKRTEEIHKWLESNNITNADILACLYKRELGYISLVMGMLKQSDYKDAKGQSLKVLEKMDTNAFSSKYFDKRAKKEYKMVKNHFDIVFFARRQKQVRRSIISIRWNKKEKCIKLLNHTWRGNE